MKDNRAKCKFYFIVTVVCGGIFGAGILGFILIWLNRWISSNVYFQSYLFDTFMPFYFLAFICGAISRWTYNRYKILKTGIDGEDAANRLLQCLPASYRVLSNISFSYQGRQAEIDNLIVSPKGIIIIETKNYGGEVRGNENDYEWIQTKISRNGNMYENKVKNPVKQSKRQVYLLKQYLGQYGIHCWIDGYVYMLNPQCYSDSSLVYTDQFALLTQICDSGRDNALSASMISSIENILKG